MHMVSLIWLECALILSVPVIFQGGSGGLGYDFGSQNMTIVKLQPHARQQSNKFVFQYCGDHYGACHNLGTRFGKHPWLNPVMLKEITVRTSSPPGRCTIPKVKRWYCDLSV